MPRLHFDIPDAPDPDMMVPINFVTGWLNDDPAVREVSDEANKKCAHLRERFVGDPFVLHLSGIVSFIMSNPAAAMRFWAEALIASPGYEHASMALNDIIDEDPYWSEAETYLQIIGQGKDALIAHYAGHAQSAFAAGRFAEADQWAQRISAFNNPGVAQLDSFETCREATVKLRETEQLETEIRNVAIKYQRYWRGIGEADIRAFKEKFKGVSDRNQLADIVIRTVGKADASEPTIMELGCFSGFNLQAVADRLSPKQQALTTFLGVEPNAAACRIGPEFSPAVNFFNGDHREMTAGWLELPDVVDICIISRVLMLLEPDHVQDIFNYLAGKALTLVICDDIINSDGDFPIIRTPWNFIIMHEYRHLLDRAGFEIDELILAEIPDRECTGFIVASNRQFASGG